MSRNYPKVKRWVFVSLITICVQLPAQNYTITTIAGIGFTTNPNNGSMGGSFSGDNGPAIGAGLFYPQGTAVDTHGNIYIADFSNLRLRKIAAGTGVITTIAGNGAQGYNGDGIPGASASTNGVADVAIDPQGNIFFCDQNNHRIRKLAAGTGIISTIAGTGKAGFSGDGGPADSADLAMPSCLAVDSLHNIYIGDNGRIRKINSVTGIITTIAGGGSSLSDGVVATSASLAPTDIAFDLQGNLYIAEAIRMRVRKISVGNGMITTVAGGSWGFGGDGGPATSAQLAFPYGVALDNSGNIYISDQLNNRIRKVNAVTGIITTIAGSQYHGFTGDCGPATSARLYGPWGIVVDSQNDVIFVDGANCRVRKLTAIPATIQASHDSLCIGSPVILSASGMTSFTATGFSWSNGATTQSITVTPSVNTTYSVRVVNNIGCQNTATLQLKIRPLVAPAVSVSSTPSSVCAGSTVVLIPGGASTYSVSGGSFTVNPAVNTSYTVTGYDNNGCWNNAMVNVSVIAIPTISVSGNDTVCANEVTLLNANGSGSYTWSTVSGSVTTTLGFSSFLSISPAVTTTYSVKGTDNNGCISGSTTFIVSVEQCTSNGKTIDGMLFSRLFPNPTPGFLTVEFTAGANHRIDIIDATGSVILSDNIKGNRTSYNLADLSTGLYFIKVTSDHRVQIEKVVKQ